MTVWNLAGLTVATLIVAVALPGPDHPPAPPPPDPAAVAGCARLHAATDIGAELAALDAIADSRDDILSTMAVVRRQALRDNGQDRNAKAIAAGMAKEMATECLRLERR